MCNVYEVHTSYTLYYRLFCLSFSELIVFWQINMDCKYGARFSRVTISLIQKLRHFSFTQKLRHSKSNYHLLQHFCVDSFCFSTFLFQIYFWNEGKVEHKTKQLKCGVSMKDVIVENVCKLCKNNLQT
jgi:hypothetical protein